MPPRSTWVGRRLRRLLQPVRRSLETTVHPLRYLFLEITQRCNLRCLHCGSDCGQRRVENELSTEEWLRLFAGLRERAPVEKMVLIVTGGEPLCHPQLDRLLAGLKENGLTWGMVTNGYALSPSKLARLLESGLCTVTVSLDGLADSHDWLRGVKGAFERAVSSIRLLACADLPFFDVVTCVSPRNLEELSAVGALLGQLGVRDWRLFPIFPRGRARETDGLLLSAEGYRALLAFIAEERRAVPAGRPRVQLCCEGYLPAALDAGVRDDPYFCRAGISIGSVLSDGSISACPNIPRTLIQGNVRSDDLMTVWEERFAPFRGRDWMQTGPCRSCREWKRCLGNSLHLWDEQAGQTACCSFRLARGEIGAPTP